jgi:hypothetical protein
MKGQKVESSFIKAVAYDATEKLLELTFKGRPVNVVQYSGVSPKKYESLMEAPSKGEYFNAKIKGKHAENVLA